MEKSNYKSLHLDKNKYLYHLLINRDIKLKQKAIQLNDVVINILPKLNSISETEVWVDFRGESSYKYICDFTFQGNAIIEYIKEDKSIGITHIDILEEEYINLPFSISTGKFKGDVINYYININEKNRVYISIYFLLVIDFN
ncbi:hypothetical protein DVW12_17135 [Clostridium botulinum]|nr:hypothetical protein [Clostridium botulinum]